jgi:iron-sulfur cluster assembly accessory protein
MAIGFPLAERASRREMELPDPALVRGPGRRYTGAVQLNLTERAAEAVRARAREADVAGWLLRVAVVSGGCSGLTYELYFVPEPGAQDELIESAGVRVAVDAASARMLDGIEIDLADARSFRFSNPRARRACSCGASFEV